MEIIKVNVGRGYNVTIGAGVSSGFGRLIRESAEGAKKLALVTDDIVDGLYAAATEKNLRESGFDVVKYVFLNGEASKNTTEYVKILEFLAANKLSRTDCVVALGGGVTGDMAGFAAATYLRGIRYIQLPTTLLAAVDSSVGGKTGIDLSVGKNLAGCFHQPTAVICDTDFFKTLSDELLSDGDGEVVKHAILDGGRLFKLISDAPISAYRTALAEKIAAESVRIKASVVERDEKEENIRKFLNLGHTIGHAVETLSGYKLRHGACVGIGIRYIAELSYRKGFLNPAGYDKIKKLLDRCGADTACPFTAHEMTEVILRDKKIGRGKLAFVLVRDIGDCFLYEVETEKVGEFLN
ncbi:MAG: 3-dehydroquinate synthase [Clostridiales bacterium]|jgi:3-dehydroquinate synthase|nr:3-dehydroquinate synthase [Clostridiales bacterium]